MRRALVVLGALVSVVAGTAASPGGPLAACQKTLRPPGCVPVVLYATGLDVPTDGFTSRGATAPPAGNPPAFNEVASGFRVVDGDAVLHAVSLLLYAHSGSQVDVSLVASEPAGPPRIGSSDVEPDSNAVLERWSVAGLNPRFNRVDLTSEARPQLRDGSVYWVVIATDQPGAFISWVYRPSGVTWWFAERNSSNGFDWAAHGPRPDGGYGLVVEAVRWESPDHRVSQ